jgi:hypothetical protein
MATRAELVGAIGERYRASARAEKRRILDEFVSVTGYHRKHAIRLLRPIRRELPESKRVPHRRYGEAVRTALIVLWEASDRVCSKRLKPLIEVLLPALERHGKLTVEATVRAQLEAISPATMDRLLSEVRIAASGGRRRRSGSGSAVRRSVPVRTFADWNDPAPGYVEVDLVAHGGTSTSGSFVRTLVLTDVASGWTECIPLVLRESGLVIEALGWGRGLFPFPLRGMDFDNDSVFMNDAVVDWCRANDLEVTRARAYRKNDQAWVEQKNGAIVRRLVGYGRFEGVASAQALARLYASARLHANLFQPSFKLKSKTRIGARVIKRYDAPVPPVARVLGHPGVSEADKKKLQAIRMASDPVVLLAEMRAAQTDLGERVDRRGTSPENAAAASVQIDLERFTSGLKVAWREGEQRTIHRRPYRRRKPLPRRARMLDGHTARLQSWLEADPGLSAQAILERLIELAPDRFEPKHVRTVQRAVKSMRMAVARELVLERVATIRLDSTMVMIATSGSGLVANNGVPSADRSLCLRPGDQRQAQAACGGRFARLDPGPPAEA